MYWCAAQLQPSRTGVALHFLKVAGYEVYHPRLRERRVSHGRRIEATPSLFPGYAFVAIELQWHRARWSPGVVRLIMDGMSPAVVPATVIDGLKAREIGGLIELPKPPKFRPGDRVKILHGAFGGLTGLYQGQKPRQRVEILLAILGGSQR